MRVGRYPSHEHGVPGLMGPKGGGLPRGHDPAAVLRRIAADWKQLQLHAAVPNHGWFSPDPPVGDRPGWAGNRRSAL